MENYTSHSKEEKLIIHSLAHTGGILKYEVEYGTKFKVDGDLTKVLELKYEGSYEDNKKYVLHWIRDKLRKMENGQIKVVYCNSSEKRDWKQEEKVKQQLWKDINVEERPIGIYFHEILCYGTTFEQHVVERPPSPPYRIS